jgi:hypothetical protein
MFGSVLHTPILHLAMTTFNATSRQFEIPPPSKSRPANPLRTSSFNADVTQAASSEAMDVDDSASITTSLATQLFDQQDKNCYVNLYGRTSAVS